VILSEPSSPLEPGKRQHGAQHDHDQGEGIAPAPCQFGHESEVHAVNSGDQRRRYAYNGYDRKQPEQIVLLDRYDSHTASSRKWTLLESWLS
jgi:hypothetical protein